MPEKCASIRRTVLIVDDEVMVKDACKMMLKALGCQVFEAGGGKEAIAIYQKNQQEIDLVLLDMVMTDMGGGEAFDHMKAINPDVKVVLISGNVIDSETTAMLDRGCSGFIQKPFSLKDLSQRIMAVLQTG